MLCLKRKQGEGITVDGPAEIIVQKIKGNSVRIGILASDGVRILRTELVQLSGDGDADSGEQSGDEENKAA